MGKLNLLWLGILALPMAMADSEEITFAQSIYAGLLRFFSGSLTPLIFLVFLIIAVMIMLVLGFILKKIFEKLRGMAG